MHLRLAAISPCGRLCSVNAVVFQPFSNNVATCSGDKTVSLWDARTGLCVQVANHVPP